MVHPSVESFWAYIEERWLVEERKNGVGQLGPWTTDPFIQKYHFCCVRRKDDYGSRWYIEHVLGTSTDFADLVYRTILYRLVNNVGWFQQVFPQGLPHYNDEIPQAQLLAGPMPISAAYVTLITPGKPNRKENLLGTLRWLKENDISTRILQARSLKGVRTILCTVPFVGNFLAFQMYLDLLYSDYLNFNPDEDVVMGPGAQWIIDRFVGNLGASQGGRDWWRERKRIPSQQQNNYLRDLHRQQPTLNCGTLSIADVEANLCEYGKYVRLLEAHARRDFTSPARRPQKLNRTNISSNLSLSSRIL